MLLGSYSWMSVVPYIRIPSQEGQMVAEIPSVLLLVKLLILGDKGGKDYNNMNSPCVHTQEALFVIHLEAIL